MYIMDAQVGLKTTALTLFLNLFFHFLPAAALCHDFSLVDSVETENCGDKFFLNQLDWFGKCCALVHAWDIIRITE